jgi:hypothetical protein
MTNPFKHMSLRRRISCAIWVSNITLCMLILAFVLR